MKILYVIEGGLPYGSNRSLCVLVDRFKRMGLEICVAGKKSGPMRAWVEAVGAEFHPVNVPFLIWPRSDTLLRRLLFPAFVAGRIGMNVVALAKLIELCRKIRPDVIHTNVGPVSVGYYVARWLGIKHVWHLREFQDLDFGMKLFPSRTAYLRRLGKSDAIVCVSKAVAEHFCQQQSSVVYNGVAGKGFIPPFNKKERCFLIVGNLQSAKGVEAAISAYAEFARRRNSGYRLDVVGGGIPEYIRKVQRLASDAAPEGVVNILGYANNVPALMRRAKAVIVASECEAFGRVTAEAMFNGCIVIGRSVGGTAELLEPWRGADVGLQFSDQASLVEKMLDIADMTEDRYLRIATSAQKKAVACFSAEEYSERILSLYKHLVPFEVHN